MTMRSLVLSMMVGTLLTAPAGAQERAGQAVALQIEAQSVRDALQKLGRQAGVQILMRLSGKSVDDVQVPALKGDYTLVAALEKLLANSGLQYEFVNEKTVWVTPAGAKADSKADTAAPRTSSDLSAPNAQLRLARVEPESSASPGEKAAALDEADMKGVPEILVKGARTGNTDIQRTEDDVLPYVVFDGEDIKRSMATDLGSFLRTRLPMNQVRASENQKMDSDRGNQSSIDLRGLGAAQTLVLVNGRRIPGVADSSKLNQPDINGIPLSAVARIEILPSTAGGIYGGGATGGVVNIILKRDFSNVELATRYDGSFAGGGAERRIDATAGFTLEEGRTSIMLMGSYRDGNPLYVGDRDFIRRSRELQDRNNRSAFAGVFTPIHGYTTNIKSLSGANLVLRQGMVPLGSSIAHVPEGYAGPAGDNGAAFLQTAGRFSLAPADDVLGTGFALLTAPTVRSLNMSVRREFTDALEVFVDAARYDNRAVRGGSRQTIFLSEVILPVGVNNPFTESVRLSVPLVGYSDPVKTYTQSLSEQINGGAIWRLPRDWVVQGEYGWGRSVSINRQPKSMLTSSGLAALIDGRLNPLRDVNAQPLDLTPFLPGDAVATDDTEYPAERDNAALRISGPLLNLPGGPLRLAAVVEHRGEKTTDRIYTSQPANGAQPLYYYYPPIESTTRSGYAELTAPLVSASQARPGLQSLELRASYRRDITETNAGRPSVGVPSPDGPFPNSSAPVNEVQANQYTLGLRYLPTENVALRVSYGEGILPPISSQLQESDFTSLLQFLFLTDPKRNRQPLTTATVQLVTLGGNLALRPELSRSWSAGMIFTPALAPGLRLSVDFTRIEKTDEIGSLGQQLMVDLEDQFPGVVVRNPLTQTDQGLGYTGGTVRELRLGQINIARSLMESIDMQADYGWDTRFGSFTATLIATVQPHLEKQPTLTTATYDLVGYSDGPLKWRGNAGLLWSRDAVSLGWNMQYYGSYLVYTATSSQSTRTAAALGQGTPLVGSQTYHDLYGRYSFGRSAGFIGGLLENAELQLSVQNVLNTSPPILATAGGTLLGGYATEGDPRLRRYSIAFTKRFGR